MRLSESIKPISYVKSHAAEIIKELANNPQVITITQNGEAKAVLQDIHSYEMIQESLALLKVLAMSQADVKNQKVKSLDKAFADINKYIEQFEDDNAV